MEELMQGWMDAFKHGGRQRAAASLARIRTLIHGSSSTAWSDGQEHLSLPDEQVGVFGHVYYQND